MDERELTDKSKKTDVQEPADKQAAAHKAPSVADLGSKVDLQALARNVNGSTQNQSLLNIRQQALEQLSELVDNLEQSPEEHFETLMTIIQETDNAEMIDKAYATALKLKDAKERAQALLVITEEIKYFTSGQARASS